MRQVSRGFTLIEMVAVLAIVGVLAMAAHPLLVLQQQRTQEFALREALRQIRGAIDAHKRLADEGRLQLKAGESGWPANLEVLVQGVEVSAAQAASAPASPVPSPAEPQARGRSPWMAPAAPVAVSAASSAASAAVQRVYLLRRLPRDPFADPTVPAAQTWASRSSDSPPGSLSGGGSAGRDVFDVASRSPRRALDGSSYREW